MAPSKSAGAARSVVFDKRAISMAVRDFDPVQLDADFSAILDQAGITFTYQGVSVTGSWSASRDAFEDFEDQRRDESRFTVFFQTTSVSGPVRVAQTLSLAGTTFFISSVALDTSGSGCKIDVSKSI